jgi:pyruvate formate lyase activating enzyme
METANSDNRAPIFAISRLRMGIDGPGVTTLVAFMDCPLHCKYCINDRCHELIYEADGVTPRKGIMLLTPQELYNRVRIDNIYFQVTGGGICFGGGEPGLYANFIKEFRQICNPAWKITIETSLYFDSKVIDGMYSTIDNWIIDIKSLFFDVYEKYTGGSMHKMLFNLNHLKKLVGGARLNLKVPNIPNFTCREDVETVADRLHKMGYPNVQVIDYIEKTSRFTTQNSKSHE